MMETGEATSAPSSLGRTPGGVMCGGYMTHLRRGGAAGRGRSDGGRGETGIWQQRWAGNRSGRGSRPSSSSSRTGRRASGTRRRPPEQRPLSLLTSCGRAPPRSRRRWSWGPCASWRRAGEGGRRRGGGGRVGRGARAGGGGRGRRVEGGSSGTHAQSRAPALHRRQPAGRTARQARRAARQVAGARAPAAALVRPRDQPAPVGAAVAQQRKQVVREDLWHAVVGGQRRRRLAKRLVKAAGEAREGGRVG